MFDLSDLSVSFVVGQPVMDELAAAEAEVTADAPVMPVLDLRAGVAGS